MSTEIMLDIDASSFGARGAEPSELPIVRWALTDLGDEMIAPVRALCSWVADNLPRIKEALRAIDATADLTRKLDGGTASRSAWHRRRNFLGGSADRFQRFVDHLVIVLR